MANVKNIKEIPLLPIRGVVIFPKTVVNFDISKKRSGLLLEEALKKDRLVFIATQKNSPDDFSEEFYDTGVVAEILQVVKSDKDVATVLVEGKFRAKLTKVTKETPFIVADVKKNVEINKVEDNESEEMEALIRSIKASFAKYITLMPKVPKYLVTSILSETEPCEIFNKLASNIPLNIEDKQMLLEEDYIIARLGMFLAMLVREVEVISIEQAIHLRVKEQIEGKQREHYLREQLQAISYELGEEANVNSEAQDYADKIHALGFEESIEKKLLDEVDKYVKMSSSSQESAVIRTYLDTVLSLPWKTSTKDKTDIKKARVILDKDHFGLEKVKDRIIENIAVRELQPDLKGQILCLVGPPGVGKTSIGKSIAKTLGRKFARISLGGIRDESDIRGHRKTYVGAMMGRIINAVKEAGSNNPVILLDEIDKISADFRGNPSSALLEVLDSEQNNTFRDHYIEIPFDLSNVLFISTANTLGTIDQPLLDRMEIIDLTSYTREEKFNIAKKHLVSKQLKANGLKASMLKINDAAIYTIIDNYTKEAGVRTLERRIGSICRKSAKILVEQGKTADGKYAKITVNNKNIVDFLGQKKYLDDDYLKVDEVGVVNGLAWTSVGGVIMPLEVSVFDGKGTIETTGSLGDVMKESAKLAVSYVRSISDKYNISSEFYKSKDIHIHAPEGATPKDGPSAGVTMTTALISALADIPVRHDVAMTGEITLHGKVLPIGGLKEKTMAAYKAGVKTVVIPKGNKGDLEEIDDVVKNNLDFVLAESLSDVLETVFKPHK